MSNQNKIQIYVERMIFLSSFGPKDGSYSSYSILKAEVNRLWDELTNTEQSEARVLLKYKGITV